MNRDLGIPSLLIDPSLGPSLGPSHEPLDVPREYAEKRRHPRRQLGVRCWMGDGRHTLFARVHDVSLGGFSIRAPSPFRPDAELELAIVLAGALDGADRAVSIRARGRVVWTTDGARPRGPFHGGRQAVLPGAPRMGAEFLRFEVGEGLLRRLVELP